MSYAHQPGSEPISIPEQIPNPAVRPKLPTPEPVPPPRQPVKIPQYRALWVLGCRGDRRKQWCRGFPVRVALWSLLTHATADGMFCE
jgi:hypothetical protein